MLHCTPTSLLHSHKYCTWIEGFGREVKHVHLPPTVKHEPSSSYSPCRHSRRRRGKDRRSPFRSATMGAMGRSLLHLGIYPNPLLPAEETTNGGHGGGGRDDGDGAAGGGLSTVDPSTQPPTPATSTNDATPNSTPPVALDSVRAHRGMESSSPCPKRG